MRHVYNTSEIPHKWAHQTQESARNKQGNLFFEGETIYSYRYSWPIAKIYGDKKQGTLVLINSDKYSVTTAKHTSSVRYAVNHLTSISVPYPKIDLESFSAADEHKQNLDYLLDITTKAHTKAQKRLSLGRVKWDKSEALEAYQNAQTYIKYFSVEYALPNCPSFDSAIARATSIETPDPIRDAKRYQAKVKREKLQEEKRIRDLALQKERMKEDREKWRNHQSYNGWNLGPVMLRTKYDPDLNIADVETSRGARVPLRHAELLYKKIIQVRESGIRYVRNGHTIHVGEFAVDSIEPNGELHAGCHVIDFEESEALAVSLGWAIQK